MLAKPPPINWWESNSASLHQTQGASGRPVVTVSDGLMQRTYEGAAEPKRLVGELTRLSQAR